MKSTIFTTIRFIMALVTVLAVVGKPYLPAKTLLIHPSPLTTNSIYGPKDEDGNSIATWTDRSQFAWKCDFDPGFGYESCGTTFSWGSPSARACTQDTNYPSCTDGSSDPDGDGWGWEDGESCLVVDTDANMAAAEATSTLSAHSGSADRAAVRELDCGIFAKTLQQAEAGARRSIDFTDYGGLRVKVHYEGRAKFIRLYLRDFNPKNTQYENFSAGKFMSAYLRTDDLRAGDAYVELDEFNVEEWWVMLHSPPRALAAPEFAHVVTVGIDHIEHGNHHLRVEQIELVGERISMEGLLMALAMFWSGFLLLEGAVRYGLLVSSSRESQQHIEQLSGREEQLVWEKDALKTRATTDALTGCLNRAGFAQRLKNLCPEGTVPAGFGLLVIDIDHFKRINDSHGHDVGDRILCALVQTINAHIRSEDTLARWGGEEFIILSPQKSHNSLLNTAEKLRACVAATEFEPDLDINVTISLGASYPDSMQTFDTLFKRADIALYRAKHSRNAVAFES